MIIGSEEEKVHRTIERVARESYGRLVAYLSVNTHDLAAAEDALSEALVNALTAWPRDGVPQNPEAWLLTAARHSVIDAVRHQRVVSASEPTLLTRSRRLPAAARLPWSARAPHDWLRSLIKNRSAVGEA